MYRPRPYAIDELAELHKAIRSRPLATIVWQGGHVIDFAYAPVVLDEKSGARGGIRFHLAKANPVAACNGDELSLSFLGPDTYISPDWYRSKGLVPTWNYVAIEARGRASQLDEEQLAILLSDLSAQQEAKLPGKVPWTLDKLPLERRGALMRAIIGFSVAFDLLEGKFKLSQDKAQQDAEGVIEALEAQPDPATRLVASAMRASRRD